MNLKELDQKWRKSCPEETNGLVAKPKRTLPKKWKIMLDNYNRRKSICCICFNKFSLQDLTVMPDGGSGGVCKKCEEKIEKKETHAMIGSHERADI